MKSKGVTSVAPFFPANHYFCKKYSHMTASNPVFPAQLNPAQLELLQLFAGGLTDAQLDELRRILLDFKFRRVTALADQFVDEKGWTSKDIAEDARHIERRPYRPNRKPASGNE